MAIVINPIRAKIKTVPRTPMLVKDRLTNASKRVATKVPIICGSDSRKMSRISFISYPDRKVRDGFGQRHDAELTFHDTNCRDATHWGMFPATFASGIQQGRSRPLDANWCYELSIIPSFLQLETVLGDTRLLLHSSITSTFCQASSSAFASFRSGVSNPSVNQA